MTTPAKTNAPNSGSASQRTAPQIKDETRSETSISRKTIWSSALLSSTELTADLATITAPQSRTGVQHNTEDDGALSIHTMENLPYQQEHDHIGFALQTSITTVPNDEVEISHEDPRSVNDDHISICPIHRSILSSADKLNVQEERDHVPIVRYLAEGLQERYALVNIETSDSEEQWARYKDCRCMEHQQQ